MGLTLLLLASLVATTVSGAAAPGESKVLTWGDNSDLQLGKRQPGVPNFSPSPVDLAALQRPVAKVAAGGFHSLVLLDNGTVWGWGQTRLAQMGTETSTPSLEPIQVSNPPAATPPLQGHIIDIAAGLQHSVALKSDGTVWAWGQNLCGQLGQANNPGHSLNNKKVLPAQVGGLPKIVAIDAGRAFNLALDEQGVLWAWGDARFGQTGNAVHPAPTTSCYAGGGAPFALGTYQSTPQTVPSQVLLPEKVVAFAAGGDHSVALTVDGRVWSWGANCEGQLGSTGTGTTFVPARGTPMSVVGLSGEEIVAVAAGGDHFGGHSLALTDEGEVWAWGFVDALGAGDVNGTGSVCVAPPAVPGVPAGLGGLPEPRGQAHPQPVKVVLAATVGASLSDVVAVEAGKAHSVAITSSGRLLAWGQNDRGQAGAAGTEVRRKAEEVAIPFNPPDYRTVEKIAASGHNLAILGSHPPSRPSRTPTPPTIPTDADEIVDSLPEDPDDPLPTPSPSPIPEPQELAEEAAEKAVKQLTPPGPEGPLPGSSEQGGVFVSGMSGPKTMACFGHRPTPCNDERAFHYFRRAVAFVTPGQESVRLLATGTDWDHGDPENNTDDEFFERAGFVRGCDRPQVPLPGCYEYAVTKNSLPPGEVSTAENVFSDVDLSRFDVVAMIHALDAQDPDVVERREEIFHYVNSGGGLVVWPQALRDGKPGIKPLFPFLDDRPVSDQQVQSGVGHSLTPEGRAIGLTETDVAMSQTPNYFYESCGFDVFARSSDDRILAMGTLKAIPTSCFGVHVNDVFLPEGNSGSKQFVFRVTLDNPRAAPLTLNYTTVVGSASDSGEPGFGKDFDQLRGEFTFHPGDTGPVELPVTVYGDTVFEADESFTLSLRGGDQALRLTASGTILNDDLPPPSGSTEHANQPETGPGDTASQGGSSTNLPQSTASASAPAPAAAPAQAAVQALAPANQVQAQGQSQVQGQAQAQSQTQAQSATQVSQVALMDEREKQKQIEQAYLDNEVLPAELLASERPSPALPLAVMFGATISAISLAFWRRGLNPAGEEEKAPCGEQNDDLAGRAPLIFRRKRNQR